MNVKALKEELSEYADEVEVVLCSQPDRHPLYYHFRRHLDAVDVGDVFYLVLTEGAQIGYSLGDA